MIDFVHDRETMVFIATMILALLLLASLLGLLGFIWHYRKLRRFFKTHARPSNYCGAK